MQYTKNAIVRLFKQFVLNFEAQHLPSNHTLFIDLYKFQFRLQKRRNWAYETKIDRISQKWELKIIVQHSYTPYVIRFFKSFLRIRKLPTRNLIHLRDKLNLQHKTWVLTIYEKFQSDSEWR